METNPGPPRHVSVVCRILCSNVRGLAGNISDLTVASSQYDILLCSETLVSDISHVSDYWFPDLGPLLSLLFTSELFSILENKLIGMTLL